MPSRKDLMIDRLLRLLFVVIVVCEAYGVFQVWNIPLSFLGFLFSWIHLPININLSLPVIVQVLFLFLWCLTQTLVSTFLVIQVVNRYRHHDKHAHRLLNMVVVCIIIQVFGFSQSLPIFAAASALTDGLFLYLIPED